MKVLVKWRDVQNAYHRGVEEFSHGPEAQYVSMEAELMGVAQKDLRAENEELKQRLVRVGEVLEAMQTVMNHMGAKK